MTAIAIFGLATITMAQVPSYVPTNGLVGYWPFNGNANDESGNGNNGSLQNGVLITDDRLLNLNSAYDFDGIDDQIEVNHSTSISPNQYVSVNVWIYPRAYEDNKHCVSKGSHINYTYRSYGIQGPESNEKARFFVSNGSVEEGISTSSNLTLNQWHQITGVYDGASLKIYVNGLLDNQMNFSGSINQNTEPLLFGSHKYYAFADYWFNGKIDDIGIWNRALTQQEITDLYNGCQLSVNTQPTNQTINVNNNAQFVVSSSDPGSTYQWQTDLGVGYQNLNSVGQYSGTTNETLTVANVTLSNNNQPFRCIISSGSCTDTSDVAVLTVNNNVGINETSQDNLFTVFPNPAQNIINVKVDNKLIGQVYSIYDNTGKVVLTGKLNSQNTTIELNNLSGGVYMLSVGENLKQTFKVIKE